MEICEVNLHTNGGQEYLENAVKYPIDERRVLAKGFGVTTHDPDTAVMQFSKTARCESGICSRFQEQTISPKPAA